MIQTTLLPQACLIDAVRAIESSYRRMAIIVANDGKLLGTLTDGDIRRSLLIGASLEDLAVKSMNPNPILAKEDYSEDHLKYLMRSGNIMALPLVDKSGYFIRLIHFSDLGQAEIKNINNLNGFSFAVIMAGGEGARLRPLTEFIPKPMLEIAGISLLARQVQRLVDSGINRIYISINYLGHVIEDFFADGSQFGAEIYYLREQFYLGTAGALSLLPEKPERSIIVMNGDILSTFSFDGLYSFHREHMADVTVAAIDHKINIPYGVITSSGSYVTDITEKPSERYLCNAGIYALSPEVLILIPQMKHSNMTDLIGNCLENNRKVAVFPIHEYWSDIGTPEELKNAREHFSKLHSFNL